MTQPDLTNAVNVAKTVFVNSLQTAFAQAAAQIVTSVFQKEAGTPLSVSVPGYDVNASIDPTTGKVTFGGNLVTEAETLLSVATQLHGLLGASPPPPAPAAAPPSPVSPAEAALNHEFPPAAPAA